MSSHHRGPQSPSLPSRRRFVTGLAAAGAAASLGWRPGRASAQTPRGDQAVLPGPRVDLQGGEIAVNVTGAPRTALAINGSIPGPLLRLAGR